MRIRLEADDRKILTEPQEPYTTSSQETEVGYRAVELEFSVHEFPDAVNPFLVAQDALTKLTERLRNDKQ